MNVANTKNDIQGSVSAIRTLWHFERKDSCFLRLLRKISIQQPRPDLPPVPGKATYFTDVLAFS